jgi:tetratricopeptide (TPR) repeat protein
LRSYLSTGVASGIAVAAFVLPNPADASDTPLYQPAPAWIVPATLPDLAKLDAGAPANVVLDLQQRIENGRLWAYTDSATRIASPEMLAQATNITLPWMPDKGDLIIHELSIQRGGERIDLLAKGQKFTVLRREQSLEQRELTGILTATIAAEGLQVGDVLRLRVSTTSKDAALDGRVQTMMTIPAAPARLGVARARFSWPNAAAPHWKVLATGVKPMPVRDGAFTELTIPLPVAKQPDMPADAPVRFRHPALIELSTFAGWGDVSKVMAPLYVSNDAAIMAGPLGAEIAAIEKAEPTPLGRAERALELVQQKIRYLALGMNGGNYVPQTPERTWTVRYGDCKAKTLLLLAMLRAMKIEAEPALANIGLGDLVADRLPSAAAFNHVLVRATIDGQVLWLDGTGSGARLIDIHDTPPFGYVLPVRAAGADLIKIATHANARPMIDLIADVDESSSIDLPNTFDVVAVVHGGPAAQMTIAKIQLGEKEQRKAVGAFLGGFVGGGVFSETSITVDPTSGDVTLRGHGLGLPRWTTVDRQHKRAITHAPDNIRFAPDRSKVSWAAIPVAVGGPVSMRYRMRLRLPENGRGFTIEGAPDASEDVAGAKITRTTRLQEGVVTVDERIDMLGGEIAADRIPATRDAVATLKARAPLLNAPLGTPRRWDLSPADLASASQVKSADAVLAKAIANDPDDAGGYQLRAVVRDGIGERREALADFSRAIAIAPSVRLYLQRTGVEYELGDVTAALKDAQAARALDPSSGPAIDWTGRLLAEKGDLNSGIALLDDRIALGGEEAAAYRQAKASLIGEYGDGAESVRQFDTLIAEKPGSPTLMNGRCWTKGIHAIMLDTALKDCTTAIELSSQTSGALDSRAMVWFRMGRYDEALADLNAALLASPGQAASHYLRAIVLLRLHRSADAAKDLTIARRLDPSLDRRYARYGIKAS